MEKLELLAPAKNYETAILAINSGADAVYIGADCFGARINAHNSLDNIKKLVDYAHKFYVKVHVTVNTILTNDEYAKAINLIDKLYNIGVDAIIVQDMGIIKAAINNEIPPILIHASTQCNNREIEKIKFLDKIGISRIILARELSLENIKNICQNTNCEIETFIHGALCVSYSGECYFSYANGKRSANKGECAQPCRKKYSLIDQDNNFLLKNKYLLSLKDLNATKHIKELINSGVNSFKIEGRLKDENYVKNVVLHYNNIINEFANRSSSGKVFTDFEPDIAKTFNRGYTDYFLKNRNKCYNFETPKFMGENIGKVTQINKNSIKISSRIKINPQDGICYIKNGKFYGFLVNKADKNTIFPNIKPDIIIGQELYRNHDALFYKKLSNAKIIRKIRTDIIISDKDIKAVDEDNNYAIVQLPEGECSNNPEKLKLIYKNQLNKTGESDFYVDNITIKTDQLPFISISKINGLRRLLFKELMNERLKNYPRKLQNKISYVNFPQKRLNYKSNILNKSCVEFYHNCGCDICQMALESKEKVDFGVELMRTKHCLKYAAGICSKKINYAKKLYLFDSEKNKKYPLIFDCKNCEMIIMNE